jgi:hypothetical protein
VNVDDLSVSYNTNDENLLELDATPAPSRLIEALRRAHPEPDANQSPIRADLVGSNTCSAAGIVATGNAPVLSLCRRLIAAGHPPGSRLEAYRGNTLALRVRSIGEAAKLTVRLSGGDVGPPMRKSASVATGDWTDWPAATDGGGR